MNPALVELVRTTLRAPRDAAGQIMALRLTRDVLWTALALVAVGNAALLFVIFQTSDTEFPLPGYVERPLALFVIIAGMMVIYVHGMYWAGLALGGSGSLDDVLALVIWFQTLRALAQVAIIVMSFLLPALALLLSLAVAVWGFWIFLNFVAAALHLASIWQAFAVLVAAAVGLIIGLGILLTLIGLGAQGVT
ncbi:YIP1 family protein [Sulfitobacter sp. G21635-S1]|uniref:YIP1 family protein n=1 Tax=Sulfitobacter sp. G21635-S1 TaxID=3014043 RepID=UPI0022AFE04B|nr:YIP1 family protein [Sulfitobacter sp. G21635-S1]MCZ4255014.1 YIP1 family protein [Sulfitobacter sp. G21635-S1]